MTAARIGVQTSAGPEHLKNTGGFSGSVGCAGAAGAPYAGGPAGVDDAGPRVVADPAATAVRPAAISVAARLPPPDDGSGDGVAVFDRRSPIAGCAASADFGDFATASSGWICGGRSAFATGASIGRCSAAGDGWRGPLQ